MCNYMFYIIQLQNIIKENKPCTAASEVRLYQANKPIHTLLLQSSVDSYTGTFGRVGHKCID